ncbi:MAG TPA: hypothetical protein VD978_20780 [Azospirillum sp.]|nr:hypothetical protein [Azospirillum sp.]
MLFGRMAKISTFVGTIAVSWSAWVPAASSESLAPVDEQAQYLPIQSISYDFGSKSMNGYFVEHAATCLVTLMVVEKSDPDKLLLQSPTRVRLMLQPGQTAGLDSEEGRSLNLTCGEHATALLVDVGERDRIMALQTHALPKDIAKSR